MYAAEVGPGENVAVIGVGGIGMAAVQGARLAGARQIVAVDPVEFKREQALKMGATHTASSIGEAFELIQEITWGRMCDKVICAMGVGEGQQIAPIMTLCAKRGRVVVTNIHPAEETSIDISLCDLTLMEKQLVGTIFGSANPNSDIPRLMHLYRNGQLDLAGMVTREYALDDINALRVKLGKTDQAKLDQYLTGVNDLEKRINDGPYDKEEAFEIARKWAAESGVGGDLPE